MKEMIIYKFLLQEMLCSFNLFFIRVEAPYDHAHFISPSVGNLIGCCFCRQRGKEKRAEKGNLL